MKKGIHPVYREVVFQDASANFAFLSRSTAKTSQTIVWTDGKEYPLYSLDISSASHPFYTGKMKYVDSAGRVERFQKKYGTSYRKKDDSKEAKKVKES
ncbi:MAG: type B 50S ribosomal protein L31 [Planctomycetes bacterium]|nr:type B 50S ribosomal protein L31 [Planctomycetota bacterium]